MSSFRVVTPDFAVSPQISLDQLVQAKADGFALIINNRPDGEAADQPTSDEIEMAAKAVGLAYAYVPISGGPRMQQIEAENAAIAAASGPTLAFCRSGTRSIMTWALGQLISGARSQAELVGLAAAAGYDLSAVLPPG